MARPGWLAEGELDHARLRRRDLAVAEHRRPALAHDVRGQARDVVLRLVRLGLRKDLLGGLGRHRRGGMVPGHPVGKGLRDAGGDAPSAGIALGSRHGRGFVGFRSQDDRRRVAGRRCVRRRGCVLGGRKGGGGKENGEKLRGSMHHGSRTES